MSQHATAVSKALAEWNRQNNEWIKSDREYPLPDWWQATEALVESVCESAEAYQHRAGIRLIEEWMASAEVIGEGDPPYPLKFAIVEFEKAAPVEFRRTETWDDLWSLPDMRAEQVAKIKGTSIMRAEDARRAINLRNKGQPYNKKDLVEPESTPEERARLQEMVTAAKEFKAAVELYRDFKQSISTMASSADDGWVPPPESIEQLLGLPGISLEQVARMHRVPVEHVREIRDGGKMPPLPDLESSVATKPDPSAEEIRQLLEAFSPEEVAAETGLSLKEVKAIAKGK